jgi:hypothetical protein
MEKFRHPICEKLLRHRAFVKRFYMGFHLLSFYRFFSFFIFHSFIHLVSPPLDSMFHQLSHQQLLLVFLFVVWGLGARTQ